MASLTIENFESVANVNLTSVDRNKTKIFTLIQEKNIKAFQDFDSILHQDVSHCEVIISNQLTNDKENEDCNFSSRLPRSPSKKISYLNSDRIDVSNTGDGNLPHSFKGEAEFDLHEKQEWIDRDVEALREMVLSEPGLLARTDKPFLLTFLRARKFDYEKAMQMIRGYYTSRRDNKELYFNLLPSSLSYIWSLKMQTVLPKPDFKGRTVLLFFTEAWDPEVANLGDIFRAQIIMLEHIVRLPITQLRGVAAIVDCKGLTFNHVYYLTPSHVRRMVSVIQEVFPLRFKALHFVNAPAIFDWAFSLVKPFLSDTIKGRLYFHGENLKELQDHFPEEILPDVLGGSAGPVDNSRLVNLLHQNENYFRDHFSFGYIADEVADKATENVSQHPLLNTVAGMGSFLGNYYKKVCFE